VSVLVDVMTFKTICIFVIQLYIVAYIELDSNWNVAVDGREYHDIRLEYDSQVKIVNNDLDY
jgi:hypothetical protein